jgi:hypothetical protein
MKERRRQKRFAAQYPVTVYDAITNEPFGQLIDLSSDGMRVISERRTTSRDNYSLTIDLPTVANEPGVPDDMELTEQVTINAESVWCDQLMDSRNYDSGLHIVDADPEAVSAIRTAFQDALFRR